MSSISTPHGSENVLLNASSQHILRKHFCLGYSPFCQTVTLLTASSEHRSVCHHLHCTAGETEAQWHRLLLLQQSWGCRGALGTDRDTGTYAGPEGTRMCHRVSPGLRALSLFFLLKCDNAIVTMHGTDLLVHGPSL